ncbi:polysaccharide biosynthesis C-terminal domain-containing protein [Gracilimonas sp. Q87]|uniref:oligosaccharide flippase family protein n=1 Tax=Gracilimonas sp. Q87 TaxID=3384766 RepID=UPI0039842F1F
MKSSYSKRITNNTLINGSAIVLSMVIGFIILPLMINRVGIDYYGVYAILLIFSAQGMLSFFDLGLEGSLIKFISESLGADLYEDAKEFLINGIFIYTAIGVVLSVSFYLLSNMFVGEILNIEVDKKELAINIFEAYSIQILFQFISLTMIAALKARENFKANAIIDSGFVVFNFILIYTVLKNETYLVDFIIWQNILFLIKAIAESVIVIKNYKLKFYDLTYSSLKVIELVSYAKYLFISKIVGFVYNYIDKILITLLLPVSYMTSYAALSKVPIIIKRIQSIFNSTIIPVSASLKGAGKEKELNTLLLIGTKFNIVILLPIILISITLVESFLVLWVGEEFREFHLAAQILLAQFLFSTFFSFASTIVVGTTQLKKFIPISILGMMVNLILSLLLISKYELNGIVLATSVSFLCMLIPYGYKLIKIFNLKPGSVFKNILVPYGKTIVIGLFISYLNIYIDIDSWGDFILTGALYTLLSYTIVYSVIFTKKDRELVKNLVKR